MEKDSSQRLKALLVDGGMTKNDLLMQIQANFNGKKMIYLRRTLVKARIFGRKNCYLESVAFQV